MIIACGARVVTRQTPTTITSLVHRGTSSALVSVVGRRTMGVRGGGLYPLSRVLYKGHLPTGRAQKLVVAGASAVWSLLDPRRADMIGTLGEATGVVALERLRARMRASAEGRALLLERPLVTEASLPRDCAPGTFGRAYLEFMAKHGFDADDRSPVALVDDEELAYVLLRYRQVHDFWHVLCGLPPSLLGELALKWFELAQTGLPVAAFSALAGPLRLSTADRAILMRHYVPWALRQGKAATFLLAVRYEDTFHLQIDTLRAHLNLVPAPKKPRR